MEVDVTSGIHFDHGMDKMISVFGINVYKRWDVELWALVHGASVFAEYLDSDEDGTTANPEVISEMLSSDFKEGLAIINERGAIGSGDYKDSFWGVSRVEGQDCLSCEGSYQRQTIEEMFHVITQVLKLSTPVSLVVSPGPNSGWRANRPTATASTVRIAPQIAYTTIVRDQTTAYSYQKVVTVPTITLHPVANPEGA